MTDPRQADESVLDPRTTFVTREAARGGAEAHLAQDPDLGATGVREVRRWSEIPRGLPAIYWAPRPRPAPAQLEQAWVAYLEEPGPPVMLNTSTLIVVDCQSGAVLYAGSAHDEG